MLPIFLRIAWIGFVVNLLSGSLIFSMQATTYITDREFLVKILFVFFGAMFVALLQGGVNKTISTNEAPIVASRVQTLYAIAAIVSWSVAMIAGRLIAYI